MNANARLRRAQLLPWTLTALAGLIAIQSPPGCTPQGEVLGTEATSGPIVINQTGVGLTDEEIGELLANAEGGNIVVAFLSPIPGPRGPAGPQGPEGSQGPVGPVGPAGPPLTADPNLPQIGPLVGEVRMWAGSYHAIPKGWMVCDGRELAVSDYPELHQVFGVRWGETQAGMFQLPDFRNRSPMGASGETPAGSPVTSVGSEAATFGGSATHALTVEELPPHHHDISHTHELITSSPASGTGYFAESGEATPTSHPTGPADPPISGDTGGGQPHSILDPYFAITYIVFAGR